jgi:hypothetical protein
LLCPRPSQDDKFLDPASLKNSDGRFQLKAAPTLKPGNNAAQRAKTWCGARIFGKGGLSRKTISFWTISEGRFLFFWEQASLNPPRLIAVRTRPIHHRGKHSATASA